MKHLLNDSVRYTRNIKMQNKSRQQHALTSLMLCMLPALYGTAALAAPAGLPQASGTFTDVTVDIPSDSRMDITGTGGNHVLTWKDFSVDEGKSVNFDNGNFLNIVNGGTKSNILGSVTASGSFYLVNPSGINVGQNAAISAKDVVLSTAPMTQDEFESFQNDGLYIGANMKGQGGVTLLGTVTAENVIIEGSHIVIRDIKNIKDAGNPEVVLNNTDGEHIKLTSSTDRIDIGTKKTEATMKKEYGFEGDEY